MNISKGSIEFLKDFYQSTKAVFLRELKQMFSRPIYIFGTFGIIFFSCLFFGTLMKEGVPEKLPIGIVDNDHSSLSRRFLREFNSTQGVYVYSYYNSYREARMALQEGEIFGFVDIPENMYADLLAYRRPALGFYVTESFMVGGTFAYKTFLQLANIASGAVQREVLRAKGLNENQIMGLIQPIVLDSHYIENPWTHYGVYLINILLPGILQLVIILMTVFSIGYELKTKTSREWLRTANGSIGAAFTGKLIPYSIIYFVLGFIVEVLLYKVLNYPLQGSFGLMLLTTFLMILAAQAIGLFMIGLFPVLRDGLSFASIYSVLSLSLAGMTFPLESMPPAVTAIGQLFPLRYYFLIYVKGGMLGGGFEAYWQELIYLLLFLILPVLVMKRLVKALVKQNYPIK